MNIDLYHKIFANVMWIFSKTLSPTSLLLLHTAWEDAKQALIVSPSLFANDVITANT